MSRAQYRVQKYVPRVAIKKNGILTFRQFSRTALRGRSLLASSPALRAMERGRSGQLANAPELMCWAEA